MALERMSRLVRFPIRIDMQHDARDLAPVDALGFSIEQPQIGHQMFLIIRSKRQACWSQLATSGSSGGLCVGIRLLGVASWGQPISADERLSHRLAVIQTRPGLFTVTMISVSDRTVTSEFWGRQAFRRAAFLLQDRLNNFGRLGLGEAMFAQEALETLVATGHGPVTRGLDTGDERFG